MTLAFPPVLRRWVQQRLDGGWRARAELVDLNGQLELSDLTVYSVDKTHRGGLTLGVLRQVRPGAMREYGQLRARTAGQEPWGIAGFEVDHGSLRRSPRRPGPKGHPLEHYATLAAIYVEEVQQRGGRGVLGRVAARLGPGYTRKTVSKQVARARELGILEGAPGARRAGGQMTEVGRALLGGAPVVETAVAGAVDETFEAFLRAGELGLERLRWERYQRGDHKP